MKNKVYIDTWLSLKPYKNPAKTDIYYLKISTSVKSCLVKYGSKELFKGLDEMDIDLLSCFLVSYFEDIISNTNIWNSFTDIHLEHYKKRLPFYNTDEYYDDEINVQDVCFLIWYFINTIQDMEFISPYHEAIQITAYEIMGILEDAYEYAPENEELLNYYSINKNETDYYKVRSLIDNILFKTYLFYTDTSFTMSDREFEIIEEMKSNEDLENIIPRLQATRDEILHRSHTRLMGMKGNEWASKILSDTHILGKDLKNLSQKITGYFFYKSQDKTDIYLEHIASGKKFKLTKKSFDHYYELKVENTILLMGIVKWRNEWWFSGVYFQTPFDADLVLDERNSLNSRSAVSFLDHAEQDTSSYLQTQLDCFIKFNDGAQIAFMPTEHIHQFNMEFMEYYNDSLNLSETTKKQVIENVKKEGLLDPMDKTTVEFSNIENTGLVFFNPKSGIEIAIGINSAFPMANNPYFDIKESENALSIMLMSDSTSAELSLFCIKHCSNSLAFFKNKMGKHLLSDIDFLLRFWKKENYYSIPRVSYTGLHTKDPD